MLIPDHETAVDYLNCEAIASTVAEVLRSSRERPLTIGIHGDWGAGKSSVLKMLESNLSHDKDVAVLWFNGWTFEGFDDAKTVLIEATVTELIRQRKFTDKAKKLAAKLLQRIDWLKVAKRSSGMAFNLTTGMPSPDQIKVALDSIAAVAYDGPEDISEKIDDIAAFLKPAEDAESVPQTIHAFREEFKELLDEAKIDQLIVLIDDLDRCLPKTAIETLEAIRLFLFVPRTAFVIGADDSMIEYAVRQHFPDLPQSSGPLPYARNYLEKLVQIPFRIPALGGPETRAYVTLLLVQCIVGEDHDGFKALLQKVKGDLQKPWLTASLEQNEVRAVDKDKRAELDEAFVLAQRIAPMLAEGTKGNPRQIKRFLNALLMRQSIADARGFGDLVSQSVLAKLMLAEHFQKDFYDIIASQVMSAPDGISADLAEFEKDVIDQNGNSSDEQPKKTKKAVATQEKADPPSKWHEREWMMRWREIKPSIADVDLRPYVFVARDRRVLTGGVMADSLDALKAKLCGSQLTIRAVENEVKDLPPGDAISIFNGLREHVLTASEIKVTPPGMDGMLILAKYHPALQAELVSMAGSLDVKKLGPWVVKGWGEAITEAQPKKDLQDAINRWAQQDENDILKKAATSALTAMRHQDS